MLDLTDWVNTADIPSAKMGGSWKNGDKAKTINSVGRELDRIADTITGLLNIQRFKVARVV